MNRFVDPVSPVATDAMRDASRTSPRMTPSPRGPVPEDHREDLACGLPSRAGVERSHPHNRNNDRDGHKQRDSSRGEVRGDVEHRVSQLTRSPGQGANG